MAIAPILVNSVARAKNRINKNSCPLINIKSNNKNMILKE
jgi:hypothetical protein